MCVPNIASVQSGQWIVFLVHCAQFMPYDFREPVRVWRKAGKAVVNAKNICNALVPCAIDYANQMRSIETVNEVRRSARLNLARIQLRALAIGHNELALPDAVLTDAVAKVNRLA